MNPSCQPFETEILASTHGGAAELSDVFARHLDDCPHCRRAFDRGAVPLDSTRFERLDASARERLLGAVLGVQPRRRWLIAAAAAAAIVGIGLFAIAKPGSSPQAEPSVAVALVEDHIRYLAHSDRHSGRAAEDLVGELTAYVDFPVSLPRTATVDLTGARRCYLLGRRVVLAFYEDRGSPLSYFVLAAAGLRATGEICGDNGERCTLESGFAVVTWQRAGLLHGVVAADRSTASRFADAASAFVP